MNKLILFLFLVTIVSCKSETKKPVAENLKVTNKVKKSDSIKIKSKRKSGEPVKEFQKFVENIEKDNWKSDTLRLKKLNYPLIKGKIRLFNNKPFYKIDFNNTELKNSYINLQKYRTYDGRFSDSLDIKLVEKVKTIWGYFYRGEKVNYTIEDGIIEQWEYDNKDIAEKAFFEIRGFAIMSYFNTSPYLFRIDNYIFILHTRAMNFSYGQEKIYKEFKDSFSTIKQIHN
tara:strand:+ start:297 stop:983 length:687 start_codon:yes stop_codon:yes gene_type:complete